MSPLELPFARSVHDRAAHRRAEPGLVDRLLGVPTTRVLRVRGSQVAVVDDALSRLVLAAPPEVAGEDGIPDGATWLFLGQHDGAALLCLAEPDDGSRPDTSSSTGPSWAGLRQLPDLDDLAQGLVVEAVALAQWHAAHAHCPRCGAPTAVGQAGWTRTCTAEDRELYPRTDPAVIMAVVDDADRLLLAHAATWPAHRYSTLAGFVEPGEGLEYAVRREVAEETGVVVGTAPDDVRYRGSQAWPFPASLMVGFRARAVATEVRVDDVEITEARWFERDELRDAVERGDVGLPGRQSIARSLIEEWYGAALPG